MTDSSALRIARRSWAPKVSCLPSRPLRPTPPFFWLLSPSYLFVFHSRIFVQIRASTCATTSTSTSPASHRLPVPPITHDPFDSTPDARASYGTTPASEPQRHHKAIPPAHARQALPALSTAFGGSCVVVELDAAEDKKRVNMQPGALAASQHTSADLDYLDSLSARHEFRNHFLDHRWININLLRDYFGHASRPPHATSTLDPIHAKTEGPLLTVKFSEKRAA
ncbi:hypothetical protein C8R45DRAFT_923953 [Mycena sanguinolenta]|nr:hypothetical protein C8R45DRAFT_923953 [Mycena sanguinolenta]